MYTEYDYMYCTCGPTTVLGSPGPLPGFMNSQSSLLNVYANVRTVIAAKLTTIKLLSSVSTSPIEHSETWSRSSSPNSRMQQCKNTGFAPAACSRPAFKAHAAIAYTETSQPRHESMQVSSYTTYKFLYKHYV